MSGVSVPPSDGRLREDEVDVDRAVSAYRDAGYEITDRHREFLENYGELEITWVYAKTGREVTIAVDLEEALDVFPLNVRHCARKVGMDVLPVGWAFDTDVVMLLAENGDILFDGDAGTQRVANGFEEAVKALISDDWDKTFS
ncbi:SUKH-3 domain-containing protein [Streptomyces sp. NPDC048389]|uniref:SUKH-3 domain-containing protein n=1 Tax=Streptomyces sp. NPDC048389 TaxID=3154622 RepID=UPI00345512FF